MKKIRVILPMLFLLTAAVCAFAFKSSTKTTLAYGWYVMDQGTDPSDPNSYSFRENFNPTTEGCSGALTVCAIHALGDGQLPYISGDPEEDSNVDDVLKKD